MNETAHTPTPWEAQSIDETGRERGAVSIIGSNFGGLVAAALPWPTELDDGDFRRVQANAEFIVRAVNAHDDMLAALQSILANTEESAIKHTSYEWLAKDIADCARAAISKATPPEGTRT